MILSQGISKRFSISQFPVTLEEEVLTVLAARTAVCFTFPRGLPLISVRKNKNNTSRFLFLLFVAFNLFSGSLQFSCILKQTYKQTIKPKTFRLFKSKLLACQELDAIVKHQECSLFSFQFSSWVVLGKARYNQ